MNYTDNDLECAFHLLLWTHDDENDFDPKDRDHQKLRRQWENALKKSETFAIEVEEAKIKYRYWDHGRRVRDKHLDNPIIVGKTPSGYVVLDGSHRLITAVEKEKKLINVILVDVSFSNCIDDMQ
jgi:hypothetical protein